MLRRYGIQPGPLGPRFVQAIATLGQYAPILERKLAYLAESRSILCDPRLKLSCSRRLGCEELILIRIKSAFDVLEWARTSNTRRGDQRART